jgi:hypothetical protein
MNLPCRRLASHEWLPGLVHDRKPSAASVRKVLDVQRKLELGGPATCFAGPARQRGEEVARQGRTSHAGRVGHRCAGGAGVVRRLSDVNRPGPAYCDFR